MPVVLGLLLLLVVGFIAYRFFLAPAASHEPADGAAGSAPDRGFGFIANGLLHYRERGGKATQLHSPYAEEAADRRERARQRHGWKQGTSFGITAGGGARSFDPGDQRVLATSAAWLSGGHLLYFLKDDGIGGLFRRDAASGAETRLLLKPHLHLSDLALAPDGAQLAASSRHSDGVANITVCNGDASNLREVTGGDTVDTAPAWVPGAPNRLLFQSAGLARNDQGYVVAQGPASLQMLDMGSGQVAPILDDAGFDHLKPRVAPGGDLLFIRRPYEAPAYGTRQMLLDTLLFPFRLLRAVFHFLNFFSLMYSRKPLTTASGRPMQADLKQILLQGRRIDAQKALRSERPVQGVPSLVPRSWELVSRDPRGNERVLATNVASYDLAADGTIVYSNGRGVFVLEPGGATRLALTEPLVGEVFAAG